MSVEEVLKQHCSGLEDEIFQYISGVLGSPDDFTSCDEVYDAVGLVLLESMETADEEQIQLICCELYSVLCGSGQSEKAESKRLLDAPVQLTMKLKNEDVSARNSIWMVQSDSRTVVDQRKLEKADAKLKQKQEKKTSKDAEMTTAVKGLSLGGLTTSQALNKQVNRAEASGGVVSDIKIENFDIAYGNHVILSDADLNLAYGRRYGLVGRNGIGKTTLLRSMANRELQLPTNMSILHVEQEVEGDTTLAVDSVLQCDTEREALLQRERELLEKGGGPGSPVSPTDTGGSSELSQVYARLHDIDADQAPARAAAILAGLGFNPAMQSRPTSSFSGGWRMRLALARALFSRPDLLLLDEPTNMLDLKAVMWLEDYLVQNWTSTILLVSHDRTFLSNVCSDILHLHSQQLTSYRGNYETFVVTKTEKLLNQQREYEAQLQYRQHLQEFIDRWRYNAKRASQAQMRIKILEKLPELKPVVPEPEVILKFPDIDKLSPPILQLSEVSFGYTPGRENLIFDKMNLSADMDSRIALVGENGSGKTTLVKLLTAELTPQEGYRSAHRNLKTAFFSQHHVEQLIMDMSALALIQSRFPGKKEEEYRHQLGSFGVTGDLALRPICSLSGGQKSRLAFALMFMPRPNFLILDEPTNHLDVETVEALAKAFKKFKGGVVLVSHDQHLIQACANEVWVCKDGTVRRLEGGLKQYRTIVQAEFSSTAMRT